MMMSRKNRIYVCLGTYFLATLGLFFTGSPWWFVLLLGGLIFVILGGKKHV